MHQQQTVFENIVGKREIACNTQFLLFPQCFLLKSVYCIPICPFFDIISLFADELKEPKIGISGKGLKSLHFELQNVFTLHFQRQREQDLQC